MEPRWILEETCLLLGKVYRRLMSRKDPAPRKLVRRPAGCEGHLTRRQAATVLGFASEFKIREFERQGLLHAVRGPMRTAFYPRPEVLMLKARLAQVAGRPQTEWTDADLIALLEHPSPAGQPRTALHLVTEACISIERAEQVYLFWSKTASVRPRPAETAPVEVAVGTIHESPAIRESPAPHATAAPKLGPERRGEERRSRDTLIRELRDPDPRVRQQAFERLRESRSSTVG